MQELIQILDNNNISYSSGDYAGHQSIVIKGNKHKLEIYQDSKGLVSDLQRLPYTWGRMGSTSLEEILEDLEKYLNKEIIYMQLSIFELEDI